MFSFVDDELRFNGVYVAKINWLPAAGELLKEELKDLILEKHSESYQEGYEAGYDDGYESALYAKQ